MSKELVADVYVAHRQYLAGEYKSALESIREAEDYASTRIVRTEILIAIGRMDEALAEVKEALTYCPNSPRGILLLESIGRSVEATRRQPTLSELFDEELPSMERAPAFTGLPPHTAEEAPTEIVVESAAEESPGLVSETLARLMVQQGKLAEARKVYIQLSRKHPDRYAYFRARMDELRDLPPART